MVQEQLITESIAFGFRKRFVDIVGTVTISKNSLIFEGKKMSYLTGKGKGELIREEIYFKNITHVEQLGLSDNKGMIHLDYSENKIKKVLSFGNYIGGFMGFNRLNPKYPMRELLKIIENKIK